MSPDFLDLTSLPQRIVVQSLIGVLLLSGTAAIACLALRRNPLHRHTVATLALSACLVLPFVSAWTALNGSPLLRISILPPEPVFDQAVSTSSFALQTTYFEHVDMPVAPQVGPGQILLSIYLLGVAVGLARMALGLLTARKLVRTSIAASREVKALLLGDRRNVRIRLTNKLAGPAVVGLWNPLILFPLELVSALDDKGIRQVIAHELSHIEEKHLWHALLHRITAILLWPIPTVHAVRRQAMIAQEDLCDCKAMAEGSAADYARLLVDLGERRPRLSHAWPICGIWSHNLTLEARIKSLLDPHRKPMTPMKPLTKAAVFGATLSTLLLLAGTQLARAQDPVVAGQAAPADVIIASPAQQGQTVIIDRAQVTKSDRKAQRKAARKALKLTRQGVRSIPGYVIAPGQAAPSAPRYDPFSDDQTPGPGLAAPAADPVMTVDTLPGQAVTIEDGRTAPALPGGRLRVTFPRRTIVRDDAQPALAPSGTLRIDTSGRIATQAIAPSGVLPRHIVVPDVAPQVGEARIQTRRQPRGVPVLKDVPVIGRLFQNQEVEKERAATKEARVKAEAELAEAKVSAGQAAELHRELEMERAKVLQDRAVAERERYEVAKARSQVAKKAKYDIEIARAQEARAATIAKPRMGKKTIIRNATVIIHEDGTVEIQGGTSTAPKTSTTKRKGK